MKFGISGNGAVAVDANDALKDPKVKEQLLAVKMLRDDLLGQYEKLAQEAAAPLWARIAELEAAQKEKALEYVSLFGQCTEALEKVADLQAKLDAAAVDAEKYKFVLSGLSMEFAICEYDAHLNQWYQPSTPKEILSEIIGNAMRTGEPKV